MVPFHDNSGMRMGTRLCFHIGHFLEHTGDNSPNRAYITLKSCLGNIGNCYSYLRPTVSAVGFGPDAG